MLSGMDAGASPFCVLPEGMDEMKKRIWEKTQMELFRELGCRAEGLTAAEAGARLETCGPNKLRSGGKKSVARVFLEQFQDFLVVILILAAAVSAALGDRESALVILAVITMNAMLGTVQTVKAAASLESLKRMSARRAWKSIQLEQEEISRYVFCAGSQTSTL